MLGTRRSLSVLLATLMATIGLGLAAGADSSSESGFLSKINSTRSANGLAPLSVDGNLRSHARNHTQDMMDANEIFHSTSAELRAAGGTGWTQVGENVGRGNTVDSLHKAFMDSPSHRANILGEYNYVGIGTGTKDGALYVTVVFMQKGSTSTTTTTTSPPQTTTSTAAPATTTTNGATATKAPADTSQPATTTTTIPATTTTTLVVGPDKAVTPGESCLEATRYWWMCHD